MGRLHIKRGYATDAPPSTTWIYLHADAHDFSSQAVPNSKIAARLFATHFGHLSIVAAWFSASLIAGARFSNYESWVVNPVSIHPSAQIIWAGNGQFQELINQDSVASSAIRITSGVFYVWRSAGMLSNETLFVASIACLGLSLLFVVGGWYHYHAVTPSGSWFNDLEAILAHHLTVVIGLGSIAWAGHLVHVAWPTECLLFCGCDPLH